jgi:hypothetical protein
MDRSKVIEAALQNWYRARQGEAMIEHFSGGDRVNGPETVSWRTIRRAAVTRKLKRL